MIRRCWLRFSLVFSIPVLVLGACSDRPPTAPQRVSAGQVRAAVTEGVAAALDESGQFKFPSARASEIGAEQARRLAEAYWKTYGSALRPGIEWGRDAPVAKELKSCGRVFYAESAYEPLAIDTPEEFRRSNGSQWLIRFCSGNEQQLVIAVAADANNLAISQDGRITNARGGDFLTLGVYPGATVPMDPEAAVVEAAREIGVRVAGVPVLRRPAQRFAAAHSTWSFPIERSQRVRGSQSRLEREVQTVSFGHFRGFRVFGLQAENPATTGASRTESYNYRSSESSGIQNVVLTRRLDTPFELELVTRDTP